MLQRCTFFYLFLIFLDRSAIGMICILSKEGEYLRTVNDLVTRSCDLVAMVINC